VFVAIALLVPLLMSVVEAVAVVFAVEVETPDLFQVKFETIAVSVAVSVADT
jgi:hypothetical protein